jgi:hypothetical protein
MELQLHHIPDEPAHIGRPGRENFHKSWMW